MGRLCPQTVGLIWQFALSEVTQCLHWLSLSPLPLGMDAFVPVCKLSVTNLQVNTLNTLELPAVLLALRHFTSFL